jgi:hypothetical protein
VPGGTADHLQAVLPKPHILRSAILQQGGYGVSLTLKIPHLSVCVCVTFQSTCLKRPPVNPAKRNTIGLHDDTDDESDSLCVRRLCSFCDSVLTLEGFVTTLKHLSESDS